jgi:hypothetical protein
MSEGHLARVACGYCLRPKSIAGSDHAIQGTNLTYYAGEEIEQVQNCWVWTENLFPYEDRSNAY